ncbi:hypothetical protein EBU02_12140 [bacterium]|nr:hypothetical protein [bacterium]
MSAAMVAKNGRGFRSAMNRAFPSMSFLVNIKCKPLAINVPSCFCQQLTVRDRMRHFEKRILSDWKKNHRWTGANRQHFLCGCLSSLAGVLAEIGGRLVIRQGDAVAELEKLALETRAEAIFFNRDPDPYGRGVEERLEKMGARIGIAIRPILFAYSLLIPKLGRSCQSRRLRSGFRASSRHQGFSPFRFQTTPHGIWLPLRGAFLKPVKKRPACECRPFSIRVWLGMGRCEIFRQVEQHRDCHRISVSG